MSTPSGPPGGQNLPEDFNPEDFGSEDFNVAAPGTVPPGAMPGPMPGEFLPETPRVPKRRAWQFISRAVHLTKGHRAKLGVATILMLIVALMPFLVSASFGPLIQMLGQAAPDRWEIVWSLEGSMYSKPPDTELGTFEQFLATPLSFTTIFLIWAIASIAYVFLQFVQARMMSALEQKLDVDIQQKVYDHLQTLSLDFFTGGQVGALMQRVLTETQSIQKLVTQVLLNPIIDVIALVIALAYVIGLSWQMTLVALGLGPLAFILFRYTMKKLEKASDEMMLSSRDLNAELNESLTGMTDIQVFNAQSKRSARFYSVATIVADTTTRMLTWMHLSNANSQIYVTLSTALVLLIGITFGEQFGLTLASLIVFVGFVPAMFAPVQRVITSYTTYQSLVPGVAATYELLDTRPTVIEKPDAKDIGDVHGHLSFHNVVFGYTPFQKVLDGISFNVREGETVSFVGPIGSGKSTICNLILRFLDPQGGRITLDGIDISDVTLASLREQISKLSQFPFFLKDTIRENVRLGRADAIDQEVEEACRTAHIHDVIVDPNRMPKGYDTIVDVQIPSGGQKRLIALARCLLRKPEVLLLDEPTENLDADQRNRLISVIREYATDRTCLVISHDLNFVAAVSDRIIVLNHGKVEDEGTHDELMSRESLYRTLYELKNIDPALLRTRATPEQEDIGEAMPMGMGGAIPM